MGQDTLLPGLSLSLMSSPSELELELDLELLEPKLELELLELELDLELDLDCDLTQGPLQLGVRPNSASVLGKYIGLCSEGAGLMGTTLMCMSIWLLSNLCTFLMRLLADCICANARLQIGQRTLGQ